MSIHNKDSIQSYKAILNQTGTNDPIQSVLYSDLGTITWVRAGPGTYQGTLNGTTIPEDGAITISLQNIGEISISSGAMYGVFRISNTVVGIQTNTPSDPSGADGLLSNTGIEIKIYNKFKNYDT